MIRFSQKMTLLLEKLLAKRKNSRSIPLWNFLFKFKCLNNFNEVIKCKNFEIFILKNFLIFFDIINLSKLIISKQEDLK